MRNETSRFLPRSPHNEAILHDAPLHQQMENRYRIINLHILSQYQYNLIASHFNSFDIIESSSYMLNLNEIRYIL